MMKNFPFMVLIVLSQCSFHPIEARNVRGAPGARAIRRDKAGGTDNVMKVAAKGPSPKEGGKATTAANPTVTATGSIPSGSGTTQGSVRSQASISITITTNYPQGSTSAGTKPPITYPIVTNPPISDSITISTTTNPPITNPTVIDLPITNLTGTTPNQSGGICPNQVFKDVVIVGAGMAGLAAAARLLAQDPTLDVAILESTGKVGGRIRSHDFGVATNSWTIEEGANFIYGDLKDNPLLDLVQQTGFQNALNDFYDLENYLVYSADGTLVDRELYEEEYDRFWTAYDETATDADALWDTNHNSYHDIGIKAAMAQHGWLVGATDNSPLANLDFTLEWDYIDWEYATGDVSLRFFPSDPYEGLMTTDPRGFSFLLQTFAQNNNLQSKIVFNTRVMGIEYNQNIPSTAGGASTYKARVKTNKGNGQCTDYIAQRVITTVSAGVLNSQLIQMTPALKYSVLNNPMKMGQYVKIHYQFPTKFWDDAQFIRVVPATLSERGKCHHFANMDIFLPGSNILRCDMVTEAFRQLVPGQGRLTEAQLDSLLDPLRKVYGAAVGTPIAQYATEHHLDADFGFGAYSSWKTGHTFDQYAQFYGGMEDLVAYCDHNGCNSQNEWILHFSGTASCYDSAETVHGAYYAGERSANFVLKELGYNVDTESLCDQHWVWLTR